MAHPLRHRIAAVVLTGLCFSLFLGADPVSGAEPLPDPLSLDQALALAEKHPRVDATPALADRFPRRQPLYLDCHTLAFSSSAVDPGRDRPMAPLIEPADAARLEVLTRFLDVLLADLAFARYNEAMAVAYIQFDRAGARRDLGQISDLGVLELESVYQEVLQNRTASEIGQQFTRTLLGQALDSPDTLPRDLVTPTLPEPPDPLPQVRALAERATADNAAVRALTTAGSASDRRLVELELRQQIQELLLRLHALAAAQRQVRTESAYRDLKLDESRTLYDQEVTADLGYSMSQQTMTRMRDQRIAFCRALAWAELNALTGRPILSPANPQADRSQ